MSDPTRKQSDRRSSSLRRRITLTTVFALLAVAILLGAYSEIRGAVLTGRYETARLEVQTDLVETMLDLQQERLGVLARQVAADLGMDAAFLSGNTSAEVEESLKLLRNEVVEQARLALFAPRGQVLATTVGGPDSAEPNGLQPGQVFSPETRLTTDIGGYPILVHYAPVRRGARVIGSVGAWLPIGDVIGEFFPKLVGLAFLDSGGTVRNIVGEGVNLEAIPSGNPRHARSMTLPRMEGRILEAVQLPLDFGTDGVVGALVLLRDITVAKQQEELLTALTLFLVLIVIMLSLGFLLRQLRHGFRPLGAVVQLLESMTRGETGGFEGKPQADAVGPVGGVFPKGGKTRISVAEAEKSGREISALLRTVESFRASLDARNALVAVREELDNARRIQQSLLPGTFEYPGLDVYGRMRAAQEVAGDFFDVFPMGSGKIAVLIADVSGKGIAPALFAAQASASLRAQCYQSDDPTVVIQAANNALCERNPEDMFLSALLAVVTPATGQVSFVNAGHCPAMIAGLDGVARLVETDPDPVLGVFAGFGLGAASTRA